MSKQIDIIEDPTPEQGFEGMYAGIPDINMEPISFPVRFDLHAAARYVRDNNLPRLTEDIMRMFAIEG